ncbi:MULTISPECIES: hypothetical protein [Paraburkholderia]|uniref:hypothetical protein n=1 Tax=Paraburkholderia TaxID=1822464 RepID=UPI0038BA6D28
MFKQGTISLKLVAGAAGLLFAGMVQVQSSVTLHGLVDDGLLYTSKTLKSTTGQNAGRQFSRVQWRKENEPMRPRANVNVA